MSNTPLKPIQQRQPQAANTGENAQPLPGQDKANVAPVGEEALRVSVPRTQGKAASTTDPADTLESLLRGLRSDAGAVAAHGGLDPARVFGLLDDDGDNSKK